MTLAAAAGAQLFLLGGEPLDQPVVMWWNFVGTTPQDIIDAARDWGQGERFGQVTGYHGPPLPAPPLDAVRLRSRPAAPGGRVAARPAAPTKKLVYDATL